jgi:hypothetical protein
MPLPRNSNLFRLFLGSGVWQITASDCEDQPVKRNEHAFSFIT